MTTIRLRYVTGDVDRHGNARWYFRRAGLPKIRLRGLPGSEEFMAAYKGALTGAAIPTPAAPRKGKTAEGTLRWLCGEYFGSAGFKGLSPRTRYVRRRELDKVCESAGDALLTDITTATIRKAMDRRAHTPEAANGFLKAIRGLFKFAAKYEHVKSDPTLGVSKLPSRNPDGWHTWTIGEVRQFEARHAIGSRARLAMALLLYTGDRRSDVVQLGRQHVRDGWLKFRVFKKPPETSRRGRGPDSPGASASHRRDAR